MPDCEYDLGTKENNYQAVKAKLNALIAKATFNSIQAWPGKTAAGLKAAGLTLRLNLDHPDISVLNFCGKPSDMKNGQLQRILTAFGAEGQTIGKESQIKSNYQTNPKKDEHTREFPTNLVK
ncbi:hypothetical protein PtB15_1B978 [Puccinia triticina]|nr:hypothetical protein PtB15_1B978 [Puccinia triticina]